jgi:hypothetical protein
MHLRDIPKAQPFFPHEAVNRQKNMAETYTQSTTTTVGDEHLPVATFKNSLRQWQALWQAEHPATPAMLNVPKKAPKLRPRRARRKSYRTD